ncbi:MAG: MMPL family transporter [Kiritimatiellae bacterium]|nr:MMPL family transporter [Kiritimatiellia bacterium]
MNARAAFAVALPCALALALASLCLRNPPEIATALDGLAGDAAGEIPKAAREKPANMVPVAVSSKDGREALQAAERFAGAMAAADGVKNVRFRTDESFTNALDFIAANSAGLASEDAQKLLQTEEGRAKIARRHIKSLYSSPARLISQKDDPFGLAEGFVRSLDEASHGEWKRRDGVLMAERNGTTSILVAVELAAETARDTDRTIAFADRLASAIAEAQGGGVSVTAGGIPMHTARAARKCKKEIGLLSAASLAFIVLLSVFAFRSARWLPLLALSLGTSALAGALALVAFFPSFHLMTLVFGTTVLGLVVDYSFHWLMMKKGSGAKVAKSLAVSFATTELSLLPLALSSMPVLRQSATFLAFALAAALLTVLFAYPRRDGEPDAQAKCPSEMRISPKPALKPWAPLALAAYAAAVAWGLGRAGFGTSPDALYRPPEDLAKAERFFAETGGMGGQDCGTVIVSGATLDEMLEKEEKLALAPGTAHLAKFLPSLAKRKAVAENVEKLYREQGPRLAESLGAEIPAAPEPPKPWGSDVPEILTGAFTAGDSLIFPVADRPCGPLPDGVSFWQPRRHLAGMLAAWTHEVSERLALAMGVLLAMLLLVYRLAAFKVLAPSLAALATVGAALGFAGVEINLFHLLAAFLLVGMSLDYAVFLRSGGIDALKPAACSLATSMVGFGLLATVSFPVVQAFGAVLGTGLPVSFAAAWILAHTQEAVRCRAASASGSEHGASPLGMELLYIAYSVFGLRVLHLLSAAAGICIWLFSRPVRRASPKLAKTVMFARSMADKMAIMAEGRHLPRVVTDGSPDAEEFLADVKSGRGVFVLSSHVGTVEALAAIGECRATFHAWTDLERTSVFNRFYLKHAKRAKVKIRPISGIGMESAFFAGDALERGDSLVMAGDRGRGAFRFAHALGAKTYFVACVATGMTSYMATVRKLPSGAKEMEKAFFAAKDEVAAQFPDQVFDWETSGGKGENR